MNKKLFTLAVGVFAMLAGSLSVNAQLQATATAKEAPYASRLVNAGQDTRTTTKINPDYWYQIRINPTDATAAASDTDLYLTMQRDRKTGVLALVAKKYASLVGVATDQGETGAKMNESLWKIKVIKKDVSGYVYTLTNKASGEVLSFNDGMTYGDVTPEAMVSDLNLWQWYSDDEATTGGILGAVPLYAYNHKGDAVFGLVKQSGSRTIADGDILTAKKLEKSAFTDRDNSKQYCALQLVVAGPRVLDADEINSMIDSYDLTDSVSLKAVTTPAGKVIAGGIFSDNVSAVQEDTANLAANAKGFAILFKNGEDKYFRVDPDKTYDPATLPTANGGFQLNFAAYSKVKNGGTSTGTFEEATVGDPIDALMARYHWRVTYYPTPDSLVLEPLNASAKSFRDQQDGLTWYQSEVSTADADAYFNTVNAGTHHGASANSTATTNVAFDKAASDVVALILYNQGATTYDGAPVVTVGLAQNTVEYTETPEATTIELANYNATSATAKMGLKISFNRNDNYLTPATVPTGLYFINLADLKDSNTGDLFRKVGKNIVDNFRGNMMYDSPTSYQNYNHMPATQWIVMQDTCYVNGGTPYVNIVNREYGNKLFAGQLYAASDSTYYILNTEHLVGDNSSNTKGMFVRNEGMNYNDILSFTRVEDKAAYASDNGYQYVDSASCLYNEYNLKYLTANVYGNTTTDQYLSVYEKDSILGVNATPNLAFQLVKIDPSEYSEDVTDEDGNVLYTWTPEFYGPVGPGMTKGIKTDVATIMPLKRSAYLLKVRDNNLIDNEWKYIAFLADVVNGNPYYKMENLKNIDGQINKLAVFYLKNDQFVKAADSTQFDKDAFALVDLVGMKAADVRGDKPALRSVTLDNSGAFYTNFAKANQDTLNNDVLELLYNLNPDDSNWHQTSGNDRMGRYYYQNGWNRLGVEDQNAMAEIETLDNEPNSRVSAYVLSPVSRELYMPLTDKGVLAGKNIKIYRERGISGATKEYLYEDGNNAANVAATSYVKGFGYLGLTGENIAPVGKDKTVAFYVDSVLHSQPVMPQYLFYVDRDTIKAGMWCNTGEHGYNASGDSKSHQIKYNALSYGRALVNLNDSVATYDGTSINMLLNGKKYGFENYVRLGFVPAIHVSVLPIKEDSTSAFSYLGVGEWFITLNGAKGSTTFADLMSTVSTNVIDPVKLDSAWHQGKVTVNPLNGAHQNYAFSLRYTDDTHVPFLMESRQFEAKKDHAGYPGTFNTASWVKIQNNVPVLAQDYNPLTGDHTSIAGNHNLQEVINQSQIFKLTTTDEIATANDEIAASSVKVIAGNGVVTVKNAAGKKLVITNILGKAIANTVVTSDNATFAAPAGIVAVAVEGEPAVKAIVK